MSGERCGQGGEREQARCRSAIYPQLPAAEGRALMLRNGYLLVNEEHVEPFRAALRDPNSYRRQSYREVADKLLEAEPVRIAGRVYRPPQPGRPVSG